MHTIVKISCPKCEEVIDLKTNLNVPGIAERDALIAKYKTALERIAKGRTFWDRFSFSKIAQDALKLVLLACLLSTGCRTYNYSKTDFDGTVKVKVCMFLTNTRVEYMKVQFFTNRVDIVVRKGSTEVDDEAVKAISEGVSSAVIKAIAGKP